MYWMPLSNHYREYDIMDGLKAMNTNPESFILKVSLTFPLFLHTRFSLKGSGSNYAATADSACPSETKTLVFLIFQGANWATGVGCKCSVALTSTSKAASLRAKYDIQIILL